MSALNPVRTSCELCWLLIQRSWEPPAPRMAYRNDRVHSGAKHWYLQCRRLRSVVKELDERRQENQLIESLANVLPKSCLCVQSQALELDQFVCWFRRESSGQGYLPLGRNHSSCRCQLWLSATIPGSPHSRQKCQNGHILWEFPIADAPARSTKSVLFFVSLLVKTLLVISLSLLTHHMGANTVLHNQRGEKACEFSGGLLELACLYSLSGL